MTLSSWIIFLWAAVLEVGGDALIRKGLRLPGLLFIALGLIALGCYGLVVNLVRWDFSKMLGVYIGVFATTAVLVGRFFFRESIPSSRWIGLGIVVLGGLVIQFGSK